MKDLKARMNAGFFCQIHNHFQLRRYRLSAAEYRAARDAAFAAGEV
jgi:hypothetical protein